MTPHPERVLALAMIMSAGVAAPLAYYGWLFMPVAIVPGATLAGIAGAWSCHRVAADHPSPLLGFATGIVAGVFTVLLALLPATMVSGVFIAALTFVGENVL
ncbi:hypothetical protein H4W79_004318 [Nocardiopsis terrae]|uniref:DUF4190 domain-containing protein n=1 Tax=Nocardiopsis terrae TaxID=372655 RepID=A0ABR9HM30_9ACTN|nr:hypothetical protein [Nocardiopsis terrae]